MSIKSDRWIKKLALEQGMIEPFTDRDDECEVSYADKRGKYQGPAYPTQHRRCSGVAYSLLPAHRSLLTGR